MNKEYGISNRVNVYELGKTHTKWLYNLDDIELEYFNKNFKIVKSNYWSLNDELITKIYQDDKLYLQITKYSNGESKFEYF